MIRHPTLAPGKKKDELRTCKSCNLTVMAKGDWHGWKGVDIGGGQMDWFCDKQLCRQARDETIQRRSRELLIEQQRAERAGAENAALADAQARIAALEKENAELKRRQSTAGPGVEPMPAPASQVVAVSDGPIETHLVGPDGKTALCGSTVPPIVKPVELTWDMNACPKCSEAWTKIMTGDAKPAQVAAAPSQPPADPRLKWSFEVDSSDGQRKYRVVLGESDVWTCECEAFKYRQTCRHIAIGQRSYAEHLQTKAHGVIQVAQPAPAPAQAEVRVVPQGSTAAHALYGEKPVPAAPRLDDLPKFTPELIERAQKNPQAFAGKAILVPPSAYPEMNFATVEPGQLRGGIGALFGDALEVDRIEHARREDRVVGIVFTLRLT